VHGGVDQARFESTQAQCPPNEIDDIPYPNFLKLQEREVVLRFVAWRGGVASRMPGRSAGDPMNSMPADSNAVLTSSRVEERLGGTSS
jgi:hypothetical protein